jgi:putative dimethyl sulfoxide reductase chaperone
MNHVITDDSALSQSYELLGRLVLRPPEAAELRAAAGVPAFAATIPTLPTDERGALDCDEMAAHHQQVFGFEVLALAGIYLDPEGLIGRAATDRAAVLLRSLGLSLDPTGDSPEHLGRQLQLLAVLTGAKETAESADEGTALDRQIVAVLDQLLLPWLPAVTVALMRTEHPFYTALADTVWGLAAGAHRAALEEEPKAPDFEMSDDADLLERDRTGLREIADFLVTPSRCGFLLSRAGITRASRNAGVPRGFGDRRMMLEQAIFSAADHEAFGPFVDGISNEVNAARRLYGMLQVAAPNCAVFIAPWCARLDRTAALLRTLREAPTVHG